MKTHEPRLIRPLFKNPLLKWIGIELFLSSVLLPPHPAVADPKSADEGLHTGSPIILTVGQQRRVSVPGLVRYSIGNEQTARGTRDPNMANLLILKGISAGESDLWIWDHSKESGPHGPTVRPIMVLPSQSKGAGGEHHSESAWIRALAQLQETEIVLTDKDALLRGPLRSGEEARRIADLLAGFPDRFRNETDPTEPFLDHAQAEINRRLSQERLSKKPQVLREGSRIRVTGWVPSAEQRLKISRALTQIFPGIELRLDSSEAQSPTLAFHVFLLELRKQKFQSIGLKWPSPAQALLSVSTASGIQGSSDLEFALNALEGRGDAKILSRPELAVRVPGEAELFSGGELPIRQESRMFSQLTWKNFGLLLKLKVESVQGNQVRLEIQTEASELDPQISVADIPGLKANRMRTQIEARIGMPLFLSGLLQNSHRKLSKGLPILRDIPVLGALFGSTDYQEDRSELVAVLLPLEEPESVLPNRHAKPQGPIPAPRNWLSAESQRALELSPEYPWNSLE